MITAYKFLAPNSIGPFTGFAWREGVWIDSSIDLTRGHGVHACRAGDLPYWTDDELWRIELDGQTEELDTLIVASRGCLVERVSKWNRETRADFARACAWRTRDLVVDALRAMGHTRDADKLVACDVLGELAAIATTLDPIAGYAGDTAHFGGLGNVGATSYIAAAAAEATGAGFVRERRWQAELLAARLDLRC